MEGQKGAGTEYTNLRGFGGIVMLRKDLLENVLEKAISTGGDFAEVFVEDRINSSIRMINGHVEDALSGRDYGAGIRVYNGLKSVYVYTNDLSDKGLFDAAEKAADAVKGSGAQLDIVLEESAAVNINPVKVLPSGIAVSRKADIVRRAYRAAKEYSDEIVQVSAGYTDYEQRVCIANTEGLFITDERVRTRIFIQSVAGSGGENQTGFEGPGKSMGFEFFDELDVEYYGREASRTAVTMLHAPQCPAGRMPVVLNGGFGGVIFHEACGHSLEATSVAKGNSVFAGKLGEKIASDVVTAIDDGTIPGEWGSINIDDEGFPGRKNILIENGILKGYMVDRLNGRRMGHEPTGNSRRQSYKYAPTSRMTNTYIASGSATLEEIIASVSDGLYARKMGGGSVNPVTGEFNFAVSEGYLIKNGKIDTPVRGATLIGKGSDVLLRIDMVGDTVELGQGVCGSASGGVPVNVGQPVIRVSEMTVGGR